MGYCIGLPELPGRGRRLVAKLDESGDLFPSIEADMLRYLATQHVPARTDGAPVDEHLLLLALALESRFNREAEHHTLGLLAALHGISADAYGFGFDTLIGGLHQPILFYFVMVNSIVYGIRGHACGRYRVSRRMLASGKWLFEPSLPLIHGDGWT